MKGILIEVSCVVVANAHNPSILNPDWLMINSILPKELDWEPSEPSIITPPLARVAYQNGITIVLESGKLIVTLGNIRSDHGGLGPAEIIEAITSQYIEVLSHIPYSAVGNNFKIMLECEDASQKLICAFGSNGPWKDDLSAIQTKLVHNLSGDIVRNTNLSSVRVSKATSEAPPEEQEIILCELNYHRITNGSEKAAEAVKNLVKDLESGSEYTSQVLEKICV